MLTLDPRGEVHKTTLPKKKKRLKKTRATAALVFFLLTKADGGELAGMEGNQVKSNGCALPFRH